MGRLGEGMIQKWRTRTRGESRTGAWESRKRRSFSKEIYIYPETRDRGTMRLEADARWKGGQKNRRKGSRLVKVRGKRIKVSSDDGRQQLLPEP